MGPRKESGEVACGLMPEMEGTDCWPWMKGEGPKVGQRVSCCPNPQAMEDQGKEFFGIRADNSIFDRYRRLTEPEDTVPRGELSRPTSIQATNR